MAVGYGDQMEPQWQPVKPSRSGSAIVGMFMREGIVPSRHLLLPEPDQPALSTPAESLLHPRKVTAKRRSIRACSTGQALASTPPVGSLLSSLLPSPSILPFTLSLVCLVLLVERPSGTTLPSTFFCSSCRCSCCSFFCRAPKLPRLPSFSQV